MKMAQEEVDIDLNDPEVANAATKIQASFRGHKARKQIQEAKPDTEAELTEEMEKLQTDKEKEGGEAGAEGEGGEELDIDLGDPDLNKAATKIQAQFRGHVVRKTKPDEPSE